MTGYRAPEIFNLLEVNLLLFYSIEVLRYEEEQRKKREKGECLEV